MKKISALFLMSIAAISSCFATELVVVDSEGFGRSYRINEECCQDFNPMINFNPQSPARAIFINPEQVTVQEYKADISGNPVMSVTIYNKFPSSN